MIIFKLLSKFEIENGFWYLYKTTFLKFFDFTYHDQNLIYFFIIKTTLPPKYCSNIFAILKHSN